MYTNKVDFQIFQQIQRVSLHLAASFITILSQRDCLRSCPGHSTASATAAAVWASALTSSTSATDTTAATTAVWASALSAATSATDTTAATTAVWAFAATGATATTVARLQQWNTLLEGLNRK